jgi:hypothetical protein
LAKGTLVVPLQERAPSETVILGGVGVGLVYPDRHIAEAGDADRLGHDDDLDHVMPVLNWPIPSARTTRRQCPRQVGDVAGERQPLHLPDRAGVPPSDRDKGPFTGGLAGTGSLPCTITSHNGVCRTRPRLFFDARGLLERDSAGFVEALAHALHKVTSLFFRALTQL